MGPYHGRTVYMAEDEADNEKYCKDEAVKVKDAL